MRTPLFGFDIICTEKYGYADRKRYKIRSLEDDDISFFCETFRVMNVSASKIMRSLPVTRSLRPKKSLRSRKFRMKLPRQLLRTTVSP